MQNGAVFAQIDFSAGIHLAAQFGRAGFVGQAAEQIESVFANEVFAVVEQQAVEFGVHALETVWLGGEAFAQVEVRGGAAVFGQGLPGGEGGGEHGGFSVWEGVFRSDCGAFSGGIGLFYGLRNKKVW